jgi:hypothetical protein
LNAVRAKDASRRYPKRQSRITCQRWVTREEKASWVMFRSRTSPGLPEAMTRGGRVLCVGMKARVRDYQFGTYRAWTNRGMELIGTIKSLLLISSYHGNSILGYLRCQLTILHHHSKFTHRSKCHLELQAPTKRSLVPR